MNSLSPRQGYQTDLDETGAFVRGATLSVGRWLTRFVRLDLKLHLGGTDDFGPQGGVGVRLALASATGLRLGMAVGLDALFVSDYDSLIAADDHLAASKLARQEVVGRLPGRFDRSIERGVRSGDASNPP